ncbi:MAG: hypothetical protein L0271_24975, partial [Gemmatimonadetes bacterium]|nr:hypothetical protein [Gemmatimonadota bacterium]
AILVAAAIYATPREFAVADETWSVMTLYGALAISIPVSLLGVRAVFPETGLVRSLIWFLLVPGAWYVLAFLTVSAIAGFVVTVAAASPPDVRRPSTFSNSTVQFSYPRNWSLDRNDPDFDAESFVIVFSPLYAAEVRVLVYESDLPAETELDATIESLGEGIRDLTEVSTSNQWGQLTGVGLSMEGVQLDEPLAIDVFVSPLGDGWVVEIQVCCMIEHRHVLAPGIDLIRRTLKVHE